MPAIPVNSGMKIKEITLAKSANMKAAFAMWKKVIKDFKVPEGWEQIDWAPFGSGLAFERKTYPGQNHSVFDQAKTERMSAIMMIVACSSEILPDAKWRESMTSSGALADLEDHFAISPMYGNWCKFPPAEDNMSVIQKDDQGNIYIPVPLIDLDWVCVFQFIGSYIPSFMNTT